MWFKVHLGESFNWQREILALDMLFVQEYMQEKQLLSLWRHTNIGRKWEVGKLSKNIILEIKGKKKDNKEEWERDEMKEKIKRYNLK